MHRLLLNALAFALIAAISSCNKKGADTPADCSNSATTRTVVNAEGAIVNTNGVFYIIEKNTIDSRLLPCNLAEEFKVANLPVRFSGEVKNTVPDGPCCTNNFMILKKSR